MTLKITLYPVHFIEISHLIWKRMDRLLKIRHGLFRMFRSNVHRHAFNDTVSGGIQQHWIQAELPTSNWGRMIAVQRRNLLDRIKQKVVLISSVKQEANSSKYNHSRSLSVSVVCDDALVSGLTCGAKFDQIHVRGWCLTHSFLDAI